MLHTDNRYGKLFLIREAASGQRGQAANLILTFPSRRYHPSNMSIDVQRNRYRPSGRVSLGNFLALFLLTLLCAALLAAVLYWLFTRGWYLLFIVPLVGAVLLGGMMRATVGMGKCRSTALAWVAGLVAGAVMYLGYYYIGMVALIGLHNAGRLDLFPRYVSLRVHTDVSKDVGHPTTYGRQTPDPFMNWVCFAMELGMVLYFTGMLAARRASRSYCERCGKWKQQDIALFPPRNGQLFRQWLDAGEIGKLAGVQRYAPKGERQRFTSVIVEVCPAGEFPDPCPIYLAAKDVYMGGSATAFQRFDGSPGRMRIPRSELTAQEAAALVPLFPRLQSINLAGAQQGEPVASASAPASGFAPGALVETRPVPENEAGKVMNMRTIVIGNLCSLSPLIIMLASLAGVAFGLFYSRFFVVLAGAHPEPGPLAVGLLLAVVSLAMTIFSGYTGLKNGSVASNNFYLGRAKRHFSSRRNPIINLRTTTDLPTYFVEVVPRDHWGKVMLETATDIGFLQVDPRRRELRFEGNKEQYRIPAAAITECSIYQVPATPGNTVLIHHMVLVRAAGRNGPWEAPFCHRQTNWLVKPNHRATSAAMIQQSIHSILPELKPAAAPARSEAYVAQPRQPADAFSAAAGLVVLPGARENLLRKFGFPLLIVLIAVGLGIWRAHVQHRARPVRGTEIPIAVGGNSNLALDLRITNIRRAQQFTTEPPYLKPGGNWTAFDAAPSAAPDAVITIAVQTPRPATGNIPIAFSKAALIPSDRQKGDRFIAALAEALNTPIPPQRSPQPLAATEFATAVLGENLGAPGSGRFNRGGTWVATKWFVQNEGLEAEVFFNYDLASGRARFSEKDADYNADVLLGLAAAVRDGPRPPRTPLNDPNFTTEGPRVVDLQPIPNSARCSPSFARGGKLLILSCAGPPAVLRAVPLASPDNAFVLGLFDGRPFHVICLDPDANRYLVDEWLTESFNVLDPKAPHRLWMIDRAAGARRQLTGPWGEEGSLEGGQDRSLSPDGRFVVIGRWAGSSGTPRRHALYILDLQTSHSVELTGIPATTQFDGWINDGGQMRAVLSQGDSEAIAQRQLFLADPTSGAASPLDASIPRPLDPAASPDGRMKLKLHQKESVEVIDVASGASRTFTFHEDDRRFAIEGNLSWLDSRYIKFDALRPSFIDTLTMKYGYLPTPQKGADDRSYSYSPDFKWAITTTEAGVVLGRVRQER